MYMSLFCFPTKSLELLFLLVIEEIQTFRPLSIHLIINPLDSRSGRIYIMRSFDTGTFSVMEKT